MLAPLLLAASLAASPSSAAAVLANRTAFNRPCVDFVSTAPERLAAEASGALRLLGWEVGEVVGPKFDQGESLAQIGRAGALYVHSHGDHYWDAATGSRSSGFRVDGGSCRNAPTVIAPEISAVRPNSGPLILAVISTCHNGERTSKLPAAFGIAMKKTAPGSIGPRSFYLGYAGVAWVRGIVRFERHFWRALRRGLPTGAAFDQALLSGYAPADLAPEWWGNYNLTPTSPAATPALPGGPRYV